MWAKVHERLKAENSFPDGLFWDCGDPYNYFRRWSREHSDVVIVGGRDHKVGDGTDELERYKQLDAYVRTHLPPIKEVLNYWSSELYDPPDGIPFIGKDFLKDNTYVATGYMGEGLTFGTLAGIMLQELIVSGSNRYAELYKPQRIGSHPIAQAPTVLEEGISTMRGMAQRLMPVEISSEKELTPGDGGIMREGLRRVAVFRDNDGLLHRFHAVCTHLGCAISFNRAEKSWDCGCHGTRYDSHGHVIDGPALIDLEELA